jgi:hypothetical protein
MDDALLVRGLEGLGNLLRNRQRLINRDGPLRNTVCERGPFNEFHDERMNARGFLEAVDLRNVRVIQGRERLRFPLEPRQPLGFVRKRVGQNLDGNLSTKIGVIRSADQFSLLRFSLLGSCSGSVAGSSSEPEHEPSTENPEV